MQHLYSGNFFRYFLDAREDQVREAYELDFQRLAKEEGIAWVVAQNKIAYLREAHVNEQILLSSTLVKHNDRFMEVEMAMWSRDFKEIKAFQWTTFALLSMSKRNSISAEERFGKLFREALIELPEDSYEARFKTIRGYNKGQVERIYPWRINNLQLLIVN